MHAQGSGACGGHADCIMGAGTQACFCVRTLLACNNKKVNQYCPRAIIDTQIPEKDYNTKSHCTVEDNFCKIKRQILAGHNIICNPFKLENNNSSFYVNI